MVEIGRVRSTTGNMLVSHCQTAFFFLCGCRKRVWYHRQYRVVLACHSFCGMLTGKISTTLISMYVFVKLLFFVIVQSSEKPNEY